MTAHIMQHSEQQAWPMMASWVSATAAQSCGGSTWSKRVASGAMDSDSWEVRAFAEDASSSGQWPPRSYSCSFCQREFRTAQALGGHMNVHRRERAHANQLASLRSAAARLSAAAPSPGSHTATVELLSPRAQVQSSMSLSGSVVAHNSSTTPLSSSPPSQESISSSSTAIMMHSELGTKPLLQSNPDTILSETLSQQNGSSISWAPLRGGLSYHPYEKSSARCKPGPQAGARFSFCLNKVMGEHEDTLDLELRLGRSSCAV
ncbi:hypothetical protein M758_4G009900 [Ceratodon purpureus]|nr:hypothetical protein M758_4G009900 [Ceratodon purpureus]